MTAPALPGAAPDPARLPPEVVNEVALLFAKRRQYAPTMDGAHNPNPSEIKAAQEAVEIIARALGGGGEPVAWGVGSRVVVIGKALNEGHNFVGRTGVVVEPIDHAKARWVRFDGDDNKTSVPMRYLAVATAATGDTGKVEKARAAFYEAAMYAIGCRAAYGPDHGDAMNPSTKVHAAWRRVIEAETAATGDHPSEARRGHESEGRGGPDAR